MPISRIDLWAGKKTIMRYLADLRKLIRPHLRQITRRPENPDQRAQQLRTLHLVGQMLIERLPKQSAYGESPFTELGKMFDRSSSWLLKVKRFAEQYTPAQVESLCKLSDKIGFAHVQHLLAVKDRR
jgi:hypothetical protein